MAKAMGSNKKKSMATSSTPTPEYTCPHCGELKKKTAFYVSSDPAVSIGVAFPCKDCAEKIARRYDSRTGQFSEVVESSLKMALNYLDKPFLRKLYETSYNEVHDESLAQPKKNVWAAYIKNVQMVQYKTMRWRDGDFDTDNSSTDKNITTEERDVNPEVLEELEKNRKDVIK